ncbi:MAG: sulfotransferase domain-containing protein [Planctomycetota bacterium]
MAAVVSYPKSGRTWLRFMLNDYLARVAGASGLPHAFAIEKAAGYPIAWTHLAAAMVARRHYWQLGPIDPKPLANRPLLFLGRDPIDTLRSAYHQATQRVKVFDGTPAEFIRSTRYGVAKLIAFANQCHELRRQLPHARGLTYEALRDDPPARLADTIAGLGLPVRPDLIDPVVADASFDRMRELGSTPAYAGTPLAPTDPNNPASFKARAAGGTADRLFTDDDLAHALAVIDATLVDRDDPAFRKRLPHHDAPSRTAA